MASIFFADQSLIIVLNKKVLFVNSNDLQIFKEVFLPQDLQKYGFETNKSKDSSIDLKIEKACLSSNGRLLALTTNGQKALLIYQCRPEHAKLVSARPLARTSSALTFSKTSTKLLVTDKAGDCYEYDCVNMEAPPKRLFGHLSIVYDVLWTADEKSIITCDRDDKIRVTNYPDTHDIHGYCLGHKEFVSSLVLLNDEALMSTSGDLSLRIWNYHSCTELYKTDLPAPGLKVIVRKVNEDKFDVAVLLYHETDSIVIYNMSRLPDKKWDITLNLILNFSYMIIDLCYANERLFVAAIVNGHLKIKCASIPGSCPPPCNWQQMLEEQYRQDVFEPEDISQRFKKNYDNVSEYYERKRKRIEEKQNE